MATTAEDLRLWFQRLEAMFELVPQADCETRIFTMIAAKPAVHSTDLLRNGSWSQNKTVCEGCLTTLPKGKQGVFPTARREFNKGGKQQHMLLRCYTSIHLRLLGQKTDTETHFLILCESTNMTGGLETTVTV
ncbi:unnamed protein product [Clavelina lepadiformis]|uniref:PH domain-containing protein n=1 Tax=Clavelina lepadiformis TaxID=159417 RepID=A0ABP0G7I6_CLALP